ETDRTPLAQFGPAPRLRVLVERNVLDLQELKFFVSNARRKRGSVSCRWSRFRVGVWNDVLKATRARSVWISTKASVTWD
ncbi:MAG: hypothetical protein K2V38_05095, partial [Gemmataceae bacterium]|nr:hypothetical protein [Gemmataceae bacterium]